MDQSEFEERSYEAPLYNQLERANSDIYTPGQVLENRLGFDRGLFLAESALWQTLGYDGPLRGAALAYYHWPVGWGPPRPRTQLPRFRLNLFLQAKRPIYYRRKPRSLASLDRVRSPLWAFRVTGHQQRLLEVLSAKTQGRAHVAYASPAFHTYAALFAHTKGRTIVENSTFPSAAALAGHDMWYYDGPGARGAANPNPESIEEQPLLTRLRGLASDAPINEGGDLAWLDSLAERVVASVKAAETPVNVSTAQFLDDLQTLDRLVESYDIRPSLRAYAQVRLFSIRFDLSWLVLAQAA